jgi:hypothetical protein
MTALLSIMLPVADFLPILWAFFGYAAVRASNTGQLA